MTSYSAAELLQRTLFAGPVPSAPAELYAVTERGTVQRERGRLVLQPGARVTTETYFGRFPAAYYQRWTGVTAVTAAVTVAGAARVELRASDAAGENRTIRVATTTTREAQTVRLRGELDRFLDGGSLWIDVESTAGDVTVESVRWQSGQSGRQRATSIVICTYNRAEDCMCTLERLAGDPEVVEVIGEILVVDQGTDAVDSHPRYAAVAASLGRRLRYLRQPNLGGAGGFTRGLHEVSSTGGPEHAHVLLMDDDIALEPETVLRTTAFANHTDQSVIVGSQMLYLLHPTRLHVSAETADLATLSRGGLVPGAVAGIDLTVELPHVRVDAGYNAWFSCLIPAEVLAATGLPLPCFIQWDDVEFGLRAARRGMPTVTLPGAAVWHADFTWKDGDDWASYFHHRNSLVAAAVHGELEGRRTALILGRLLAAMLAGLQYGSAEVLLQAVEDFLAGPQMLSDGGVAAAVWARQTRARHGESARQSPQEVTAALGELPGAVEDEPAPRGYTRLLVRRLAAQLRDQPRGAATFRTTQAQWWRVAQVRTAVVTDAGRDAFRVRRYDGEALRRLGRKGVMLLARLARQTADVQREWQAAAPFLTSRDNWVRLFHGYSAATEPAGAGESARA